ncbi:hypothetical protein [Planococcus sp. YIM B11945]|uniref:hypothetical protein n=1 Tax=Planococcus sp. YIM B11945 TaxID=3435410 RepID=UPI003D7ED9D7
MNGTNLKIYANENGEIQKIKVQRFKKEEKVSDYTMKVGSKLIVNQLNKQAKKNRGREVEVTGFKRDEERKGPLKAKVKYLDNNRAGSVEIGDLDVIQN